jgi:uncharacterized membrane protein YdfJ with MMPL/SSD domain
MPWPDRLIAHHRLLLAAWVIAALLLALQAQAFGAHVNYSFDPFIPSGLEAKKAQELAKSLFAQNDTDEEFIVIKAEGGYVASGPALQLLKDLQANISGAEGLRGLLAVRSLASVYEQINGSYWAFVNVTLSGLREGLRQNISLVHGQLFSLYAQLSQLHTALFSLAQVVNGSSSLVYGLPTAYVEAWFAAVARLNESMPGQPIPASLANLLAFRQVNSSLTADNLSRSYLFAFYVRWNASFSSPYIQPLDLQQGVALERAQRAIDEVMPVLLNSSGLGERAKALELAWRAMNITQWPLPALRYGLSLNASADYIAAQQGIARELLERLKALGAAPPASSLENLTVALFSSRSGLDRGLLTEIMALGPQPSEASLNQLVGRLLDGLRQQLLERYPPPSYPNSIPRELFRLLADPINSTTLVVVSFQGNLSRDDASHNVQVLRGLVQRVLSAHHSQGSPSAYVTGAWSFSLDVSELDARDVGNIDRVTVIAVFLLLMGLLASAVAPLLPLALIGSALVMSLGALSLLAQEGFKIFYLVRSTISVVTLGAGIDYVVYMLFRYLEEREFGAEPYEATLRTTKYAGETVLTSAFAVMVGFGSLVASRVGVLQSVGASLTLGVLFALIAALLLVPSLLILLGDRILWPRRRLPSFAYRLQLFRAAARVAIGRRRQVLALGIALTVLLGFVALTMNRTYNDLDMVPAVESKQGFQLILERFGAQDLSPSYAIVLTNVSLFSPGHVDEAAFRALDAICSAIRSTPGVAADSVRCPTRPDGAEVRPERLQYNRSSAYMGKDGKSYLYSFGLTSFYSSEEAFDSVRRVRESISSVIAGNALLAGSKFYVGGPAAFYLDLSTAINEDYSEAIIPAAFVGIFIVLLLLLRSAVIPLLFLATTSMSTIWTIGLMVLVFQYLIGVSVYWLAPIILFTVLIGLGMDYNVFLITRVREGVLQGLSDEEAAAKAVERTALVLTAAGLIMAAAFGSLLVSPNYILKQTGFALSVGILLDTSIVRLLMSPAIIASAKKWNWWPSRPSPSPNT